MSTTDKIILQHLRSSDIINDSTSEISKDFDGQNYPKIPNVSDLEYGEIALNIAKEYEIIGIKNNNGEFVYLPFNLAKRMIEVEVGLEDLREYAITNINELSASTIALYNNIEEFKISIKEELSETENKLNTKIDELSGNTNDSINQLSAETFEKISQLSGNTNEIVIQLSADTYNTINSISADTYNTINQLSSNTYNTINQLSGATIESIQSLSAETFNAIFITSSTTEYELSVLSAGTFNAINSLSASTFETINQVSSDTYNTIGNISADTYNTINQLSSNTYNSINQLSENTIESINSLSAETFNAILMASSTTESDLSVLSAGTFNAINSLSADTFSTINRLSAKTESDINGLNEKIEETSGNLVSLISQQSDELNEKIESLSSSTQSTFENVYDLISSVNDNLIEYVNNNVESLSAYTTNASGSLYTYITQVNNQITNRIDNLELDDLSDVEIVEHGEFYPELDKEYEHENCYIKINIYDAVFILHGNWNPAANNTWDFVDYVIVEPKFTDIPDMQYQLSGKTINSQVSSIKYINTKGEEIIINGELTERVCEDFVVQFSTNATITTSVVDMNDNKVLFNGLSSDVLEQMRYVYIENCPNDCEVFLYQNSEVNNSTICSKFEGFSNVWLINGHITQESAIGIMSTSSSENINTNILMCGDTFDDPLSIHPITLCYGSLDGGLDTVLTDENPSRIIEFLSKSGNTWTNEVIGAASKERYGIVKVGDNISVNDGTISVIIDPEPISGSTNPVAGSAIYEAFKAFEVLTNEEMDILLGGTLPVYLSDENGEMILDEEGNLIELI